jgi:SsrA-binding protein
VHINPYDHGNVFNHDPVRPRKLLLHRREIKRLFGQTAIKGHSLIPLRAYFKRGNLKVELGLCKGKQAIDKREDIKRKTADREMERAMRSRTKR